MPTISVDMLELNRLSKKLFSQHQILGSVMTDKLYAGRNHPDARSVNSSVGKKISELAHIALKMQLWTKGMIRHEQEIIGISESNAARRLCSDGYFSVCAIDYFCDENSRENKMFYGQSFDTQIITDLLNTFDAITRQIKEMIPDE